MQRQVKGILFADYVRMIRGQKNVDWRHHLSEDDLRFLQERIDPGGWYPMEAFERMGNAILAEVAGGSVEGARMWGRLSVDQLRAAQPRLVAEGDPLETIARFRVLRETYFDFEALSVRIATPEHARIAIRYQMGAKAEEAASYQTMGFFERLVEMAGGVAVTTSFVHRSWEGDVETWLDLQWRMKP